MPRPTTISLVARSVYLMQPIDAAWVVLKGGMGTREKPHITWLTPDKEVGWINGKIMMQADVWAANNPGRYTESISTDYYDKRGLPRPGAEEEAPPADPNAAEQEAFQRDMFDEQGNLRS